MAASRLALFAGVPRSSPTSRSCALSHGSHAWKRDSRFDDGDRDGAILRPDSPCFSR